MTWLCRMCLLWTGEDGSFLKWHCVGAGNLSSGEDASSTSPAIPPIGKFDTSAQGL